MSLLPDKNLIIVTSALNPVIGVVQPEDRFKQTIDSLHSLRKHFPNDIIVFTDGSPNEVEEYKLKEIVPFVNVLVCWNTDPDIKLLASNGRKSESEIVLLFKTLRLLMDKNDDNMMASVKRIFKFSARSTLHDSFDIKEYDNLFGKYVFKKKIPSWKNQNDYLFITRMYSFCISLLNDYLGVLMGCFKTVQELGLDTEHAHYRYIKENRLIEFDKLHCDGIVAGTGATETY